MAMLGRNAWARAADGCGRRVSGMRHKSSIREVGMSPLLLILLLVLILFAVGGGVWVSNLLWLLLVVALIVLVVGLVSGRRTV